MRILFIGEIVTNAGIFTVKKLLPKIKKEQQIDFVIASGEGATSGFGLGKNHSIYLRKLGIDVITLGEKGFYKKDMVPHLQKAPYILRPANYPVEAPGRGYRIYTVKMAPGSEGGSSREVRIGVIHLIGQSGFHRGHPNNPFHIMPQIAEKLKRDVKIVLVDFHATTTAEKYTMFHLGDGLVSAIMGSHTKVLTADGRVLEKGTAVLCDTGRTGSIQSVGGLDPAIEIQKYLSGIPERSESTWEGLELQGAIVTVDEETGRATEIETLRIPCEEKPDDREGNNP